MGPTSPRLNHTRSPAWTSQPTATSSGHRQAARRALLSARVLASRVLASRVLASRVLPVRARAAGVPAARRLTADVIGEPDKAAASSGGNLAPAMAPGVTFISAFAPAR